ncbi:MAG TPA: CAP domain-containing protein, partial [Polyangiaceae bacterium]
VPVPVPVPAGNPSDPLEALRARCVHRLNELRARVTSTPLARRPDREACEDTQAQSDGATHTAHGAFGRCQEGGQNECPGWPGPLDEVIDKCLAQMFAEGPGTFATGHGHYLNMVDPNFRSVSCGFSTTASGQTWIVQDFYR